AENGLDAIKLFRKSRCHVMLLDISMPDRNGIEVLKQIKQERPELAVLMLSMHREDQYAIRALKAGAAGYLTKQSAPRELVTAIRQVAGGQKYVSATLAQALANQVGADHDTPVHDSLSDREFQTLTMIASGKTVSEIARELSLSVKTVSEYRSRLLAKMNLKTSAELTHYAIRNQLVD
ncbi:MAG: two-component system, NarL family, invasion response regulator UvrY, partial [Massilia sp.]